MKLWVFSDLHLEVGLRNKLQGRFPEADVAVVAGDVSSPCERAIGWLGTMVAPAMPVVYVAGNHEFYHGSLFGDYGGYARGKEAAQKWPGVHFLENETVELDGVRFAGATLWADYALQAETDSDKAWSMAAAEGLMNDHKAIDMTSGEDEPFTPSRALQLHEQSRSFLRRTLAEPFGGPTVVVTHHAPHPKSIHPRFSGSMLNPAFASNLESLIQSGNPDLWVHGHVHNSCDYRVGRTRVVANPHGYGKENPAFDPRLVVEIEHDVFNDVFIPDPDPADDED